MKQSTTLKKFLLASCVAAVAITGDASAQIHPAAYGAVTLPGATTPNDPNFYKDFVGTRFVVNSPASVAGQKKYTAAFTGTTPWGTAVTTPIISEQVMMAPGDSLALNTIAPLSMVGKIALIYRGNNEFVCKAQHASAAGADAIVIVNNITGGPVGMGSGTTCPVSGVTIPVFMISKEDGDAIRVLYRAGTDTARITITPWGIGLNHDLGFVDGGIALSHAYAIPTNQLATTGNPAAYNLVNGAVIANYGLTDVTDVALTGTMSFTPADASTATVQHTETVNLPSFPTLDSIYAMFKDNGTEFTTTTTGKGRYDLSYHITSTVGTSTTDDFEGDNTASTSFYTTDSLYSKGRYDFVANAPIYNSHNSFGGGSEFVWGPMYYVKNGGASISTVQYSLASNTAGALSGDHSIFLFKWVDGSNSQPQDSVMQSGELTLVSLGQKTFDGVNDTSGALLTFSSMGDANGNPTTILLESNSWYYLAIDVPASLFLGADGVQSAYPRIFGRFHNNRSWLDYTSVVGSDLATFSSSPADNNAPAQGSGTNFLNSVDSFNYSAMKGLIPAVAMIVNNNPVVAVAPVTKVTMEANIFPNPASDVLNVAVNLEQTAKTLKISIIDGLGRFVSSQSYNDVKNGTFQVDTKGLKSGNYFMIMSANGKAISRNFVITKN